MDRNFYKGEKTYTLRNNEVDQSQHLFGKYNKTQGNQTGREGREQFPEDVTIKDIKQGISTQRGGK